MKKDKLKQALRIMLGMEIKFTESKLKDGTAISYDKLEIGSNLLIKTDSENAVPAPEGSYELQDGTVIEIGPSNLITNVTPGNEVEETPTETPEEVVVPEEMPTETPTETEVVVPEEVITETPEEDPEMERNSIMELETRIANLEQLIADLTGQTTLMSADIKEIKEAPLAQPVHLAANEQKETNSRVDAILELNRSKK